jgi:hypothetical protein
MKSYQIIEYRYLGSSLVQEVAIEDDNKEIIRSIWDSLYVRNNIVLITNRP